MSASWMMAMISLSRARAFRTMSAASASVSRTTLAAAASVGPNRSTLMQTVRSSSAAMGVRGSHQTAVNGTRHHKPYSHPAMAGSPVPSSAASPRNTQLIRVSPPFKPRSHCLVANDERLGPAAELLFGLQRSPEPSHAVSAASHHEKQVLQKEDDASVVCYRHLAVQDVLHTAHGAQRLVWRDVYEAVMRHQLCAHPYHADAPLPLRGFRRHQAGGASVAASARRRAAASAAATPASSGAPRHAGPTIRWKAVSRCSEPSGPTAIFTESSVYISPSCKRACVP
eukprot:6214727-Pleurochrysis_carterae.AAC.2